MLTVAGLHHQAMRKAAEGDRMARRGQKYKAKKWWKYAARQEEAAFRQLDPVASDEPTRCILAVSAATLWWRAGNFARALGIIRYALPTARPFEHRELVGLMRQCEIEKNEG